MTEPSSPDAPSEPTIEPGEVGEPGEAGEPRERIFLVVVDETEEMQIALHFACRRAQHTGGRVAMLYAIEPAEFQHWLGVERMMQDEAREQAEQTLQTHAAKVQAMTGKMPILHIREGRRRDELVALIGEEPRISLLVLGTATDREGPGPLVSDVIGQAGVQLRLPVTLVPGHLTEAEIDAVT
jgi:nucleotide-binding universal stress UspA family protein